MKRHSALAGLLGGGVLVFLAGMVHVVQPAVPFLPSAIAQAIVRAPPGGVASFFIDLLGHWAQRLALIGTAVAVAASGAVLGLGLPRGTRWFRGSAQVAGSVLFMALWAISVAVYPKPAPPALARWPFAAASLPMYLLAGAVAGVAYVRLAESRDTPVRAGEAERSRRAFLAAVGMGGVGVLLGVSNLDALLHPAPDPGNQLLRLPGLAAASPPPLDRAFASIPGLSPEVTPIGQFYVVDESLIDPDIDPATWRMSVGGLVERPLALTYDELKRMPLIERYQTLECISNKVGGDLISNGLWAGVRLRDILQRAGLKPGAVEVVFRAAGGYSDSLPLDHAMDPTTLVAIGMNGHVLPRAHGFPARLLSVGTYGMKNPKWLTSIEAIDHRYTGFWEARGWNASAPIKTSSRIDTAVGPQAGERVTIAGIAFAGDRGVDRIDVSADGGRTWKPARLEAALSPYSWRRWRYIWTPSGTGRSDVVVRAIDGRGAVQIQIPGDPFPSGATGYDSIVLTG